MFGRKGLVGQASGRSPKRVPFEPEGSTRFVHNAVARGSGPVPVDAIVEQIRRSERANGRDSLTNLETKILEVYNLEAYAIHQGGFDYYLAHTEGPELWADAAGALYAMGRDDSAAIMRDAVELFLNQSPDGSNPDDTKVYFARMQELDRKFSDSIPNFEEQVGSFAEQYYPFSDRV